MNTQRRPEYLEVLTGLLAQPTAPFHEQAVVEWITRWAERRPLELSRDSAGNLFLHYRPAGQTTESSAGRPHWVLAAHMDHPGFVARGQDGLRVTAEFLGSVEKKYFAGSGVRFFCAVGHEAVGTIQCVQEVPDTPWFSCDIELAAPAEVAPGVIGGWDVPAVEVKGEQVWARGCDDVAGVAGVICALGRIAAAGHPAIVTALLTRAEEAGFIGALAACQAGSIPPGALIVAVESSKVQPGAGLGDGVVVRVGDRARTFDPSPTAYLADVAERLHKANPDFRFVRQLMPGGTCESTAYAAFGHTATGLCLPMENYHNQGADGRIAPEVFNLSDFACLVELMAALPADTSSPAENDAKLRARMDHLLATRGKYLCQT